MYQGLLGGMVTMEVMVMRTWRKNEENDEASYCQLRQGVGKATPRA